MIDCAFWTDFQTCLSLRNVGRPRFTSRLLRLPWKRGVEPQTPADLNLHLLQDHLAHNNGAISQSFMPVDHLLCSSFVIRPLYMLISSPSPSDPARELTLHANT